MSYGVPKLALKIGDLVTVDVRRDGHFVDGEVVRDTPRISALCAGSIEWLIRLNGLGTIHGEWVSEPSIKMRVN